MVENVIVPQSFHHLKKWSGFEQMKYSNQLTMQKKSNDNQVNRDTKNEFTNDNNHQPNIILFWSIVTTNQQPEQLERKTKKK